MSTHTQMQVGDSTSDSDEDDAGTARGKVYAQIIKQHSKQMKIRWTTKEMVAAVDGDISDCTVRDAFKEWTEEELLRHEKWSRYWYLEPDWF